jgi:hypothetical protein
MALGAAVVTGWLVSLVGQWFYLVLFFPIGIGIAVGVAGPKGIKSGKVRHRAKAGMIGLVTGAPAMVTMHFFDYQRFLGQLDQELPGG